VKTLNLTKSPAIRWPGDKPAWQDVPRGFQWPRISASLCASLETTVALGKESTEGGNFEGRCLEPRKSTQRTTEGRAWIIPGRTLRLFRTYRDLLGR
jgi:hypothetical protein